MTKRVIFYVVSAFCVAIAASYWVGYQQGSGSSGHTQPRQVEVKPLATNPPGWEMETVKVRGDYRQKLMDWQQEGWAVTWISARMTQADGTTYQTVKLRRAKP